MRKAWMMNMQRGKEAHKPHSCVAWNCGKFSALDDTPSESDINFVPGSYYRKCKMSPITTYLVSTPLSASSGTTNSDFLRLDLFRQIYRSGRSLPAFLGQLESFESFVLAL